MAKSSSMASTVARMPVKKRPTGLVSSLQMVFQNPFETLNPSHSVGAQIGRVLKKFGVAKTPEEIEAKTYELLDLVKLPREFALRKPRQLSGGQKQRIGIARAFGGNATVVVADEPVSALDVSVQAAVTALLTDIQRDKRTTMVFISHDLSVVRYLADRIVVMYLGRIMEQGTTDQVFAPPYHPYTEALALCRADRRYLGRKKHIVLKGELPSPMNPPPGCPFQTRCPRKSVKSAKPSCRPCRTWRPATPSCAISPRRTPQDGAGVCESWQSQIWCSRVNMRQGAARRRKIQDIVQKPWAQFRNPFPKARLVSDDQVETIHLAALDILERIGIRCQVKEARDILAKAGVHVDESDGRVRLGREIVEAALKTVPSEILLTPRNPGRAVKLGHDDFTTAAVLGPPNCTDLIRGRRSGSLADMGDVLKLTQFFNAIQMNGWPVEPLDVEVRHRHLDAALAMLTLTDKVPYVFCQSRQRIEDVLTMCAIAREETLETFPSAPACSPSSTPTRRCNMTFP